MPIYDTYVKNCPRCGEPAVINGSKCAGCGHLFRTKFVDADDADDALLDKTVARRIETDPVAIAAISPLSSASWTPTARRFAVVGAICGIGIVAYATFIAFTRPVTPGPSIVQTSQAPQETQPAVPTPMPTSYQEFFDRAREQEAAAQSGVPKGYTESEWEALNRPGAKLSQMGQTGSSVNSQSQSTYTNTNTEQAPTAGEFNRDQAARPPQTGAGQLPDGFR